ncbi:flagellin [Mesorhizobium sp. J428]|uniref:flagellin N-terminal helical domain-containing protein n=1 Tax=Mesorhizobium sp. J428 TaxID=2898440 RepID=UPI0021519A76|nr:flagellin [Mesorhizobium sp. J428]MCR5855862.1 flagellin [Mesorhizobium sp. J428]
MTSILTNASAMTALQSLQATNKALETTQSRISTGLRVAEAADNAAYWSIATTMKSDNKALSSIQDSLGLGASRIDTAYTAINSVVGLVDDIKQKLVSAIGASESDKAKIQSEITELQKQLKFAADAATFSGANWLSVDSSVANGNPADGEHADAKIVAAFNRSSAGDVTLGTIDINVQSIKLFDAAATTAENQGIVEGLRSSTTGLRDDSATVAVAGTYNATDGYSVYTLTVEGFLDTQIEQMLTVADQTLADLTDAATVIGAAKTRIDMQQSFTASLMDSIERGVGQLVDADMNEESTRLQALQVQQQLGIQALSIANSNAQNVLSLFK